MATNQKYEQRLMDVIREIGEDGYTRGFHDGLIKGNDEGFNRGVRKGILEMEKLYGRDK